MLLMQVWPHCGRLPMPVGAEGGAAVVGEVVRADVAMEHEDEPKAMTVLATAVPQAPLEQSCRP